MGSRLAFVSFRYAALGSLVASILFLMWIGGGWGGEHATLVFSDLGNLAAPLAAALACWLAAKSAPAESRTAWRLLGAATLAWGLGQLVWSWYEIALGVDVPFPSLADVGYLALIPLAAAGIVAFPSGKTEPRSRYRTVLDGLIVASGVLFVSWAIVLGPVYEASTGGLLESSIGLAYPLGDAALITFVLIAAARGQPHGRHPLVLVAFGLAGIAISDSLFAYLTATEAYATGSFTDIGWFAGFLLIGLGALRSVEAPASEPGASSVSSAVGLLLPIVPIAVAAMIAIQKELSNGFLEPFLFWTALVVVVLVVGRQTLTLLDNRRLTSNVKKAYEGLQRAETLRVQMLNNVAHDLATPLTPIQIQLHLMGQIRSQFSADTQKGITIMERNVKHLKLLLADLADLAKIQAGRLQIRPEPVDVAVLLREASQSLEQVAQEKNLRLETEVDAALPVQADPARLNQVVYNLLTNALKFTPPGGRVSLRGRRAEDRVRIEVCDTGRGLSPHEMARLFQPFSQLLRAGEAKESGTGLGLYISKGIVEGHGGRLWVQSEGPEKGSTFICELAASKAVP